MSNYHTYVYVAPTTIIDVESGFFRAKMDDIAIDNSGNGNSNEFNMIAGVNLLAVRRITIFISSIPFSPWAKVRA